MMFGSRILLGPIFVAFTLSNLAAASKEERYKKAWDALGPYSLAMSPLAKQFYSEYKESKKLVPNNEICKVAKVFGFQNRTGVIPFEQTTNKHSFGIADFMNEWHNNRRQQSSYMPPFPFHSCIPMISHKYKFIFIGIPKTGYRSTKEYFIRDACNGTQFGCLAKLTKEHLTEEEYLKIYDTYFKFTFVRNPYVRAASAYNMMSGPMKDDNGNKCMPSFKQHCQDPYNLKELCNKYYDKIQTNNKTGDCCCYIGKRRMQDFLDMHLSPQSPCAFDKNGNSLVDFIGRVEHYEEDFLMILNEINKRSEHKLPIPEKVLHIGKQKSVESQTSNCDYVSQVYVDMFKENKKCLDPIRKYYWLDFKMYKFDE